MSLKCAGIKTSLHPQYWALRCAWAFRSSFLPYQHTDTVNLQLNVSHSCVLMRNHAWNQAKNVNSHGFLIKKMFSSTWNKPSERFLHNFKPVFRQFHWSKTNFSKIAYRWQRTWAMRLREDQIFQSKSWKDIAIFRQEIHQIRRITTHVEWFYTLKMNITP